MQLDVEGRGLEDGDYTAWIYVILKGISFLVGRATYRECVGPAVSWLLCAVASLDPLFPGFPPATGPERRLRVTPGAPS